MTECHGFDSTHLQRVQRVCHIELHNYMGVWGIWLPFVLQFLVSRHFVPSHADKSFGWRRKAVSHMKA